MRSSEFEEITRIETLFTSYIMEAMPMVQVLKNYHVVKGERQKQCVMNSNNIGTNIINYIF